MLHIRTVIIKVTNDCNLQCKYCFLEKSVPRSTIIAESTMQRLLDELEKVPSEQTINLVWHGGEPTLAGSEFFCRMKTLQENRMNKFGNLIQTNGTLLSDKFVRELNRLDFKIGLSLDGPCHLNDCVRVDREGNGSYHRVLMTMETLRKYGIPFGILATIAKHNGLRGQV